MRHGRVPLPAIRIEPAALRLSLFGFVLALQLGHVAEHILVKLTRAPFFGPAANSEEAHLIFNGMIALYALVLVWLLPQNPWVYALAVLSVLHGIEHVYIYELYLRTGIQNGPGLLGAGGALGLVPLDRMDLHNVYNGLELILITLGFWNETEVMLANERERG